MYIVILVIIQIKYNEEKYTTIDDNFRYHICMLIHDIIIHGEWLYILIYRVDTNYHR